ncbi:MAG: PQQ-binding-like beta-propeller repeat protein [Candidatus Acidiferrales bacterium]|jgi:polyvinyl alcohol dehydrogenase (cytochrome)
MRRIIEGEMKVASAAVRVLGLLLAVTIGTARASAQAAPDGAALFKEHCATCHQGEAAGQGRAPTPAVLAQKSREEIIRALESGTMVIYGNRLTSAERRAVAAFLSSNTSSTAELSAANPCASAKPITPDSSVSPLNWNGWGADVLNSRYQPHTDIRPENVSGLKLKWAFGVPNTSTAYGQPTVVAGRVFIGSGDGTIYALDAATGCTIWTYKAETTVRTAITVAGGGKDRDFAYFGDGEANLYAVDAEKGTLVWKVKADPHPFARITGAPTLYRGRLYVPLASSEELTGGVASYPCCTFRGNVVAVNALTGKQIWKGYAILETPGPSKEGTSHAKFSPAGAAIWDAPTIDEKLGALYVGTGDAYVDPAADGTDAIVAFDLATGKRLWVQQKTSGDVFNFGCLDPHHIDCPPQIGPDVDFGSSPILRDLGNGHRVLLAGQKSGVMYALDPDDGGKELWQVRVGHGSGLGGIEWGSATDGTNVYVANSDISTLTPVGPPGTAPPPAGGLSAIDIRTGKLVWKTMPPKPACQGQTGCSAGQLAAVTVIPGVVFSGSMDGHLRAYSSKDGKIIWDFDTLPDFTTVNSVKAHGGSMSGSGPVVAGNMLFVTSGFDVTAGMPGNLVLAFEEASGSSGTAH